MSSLAALSGERTIDRREAVSIDPATGNELARYPFSDPAEQEIILAAAWNGFRAWRAVSVTDRMAVFRRMAITLRETTDRLARLITLEMGKPIAQARAEVGKCADLCEWYATHAPALLAEEQVDVGTDGEASIAHLPLGPILAVMPWNFPLWQVLRAAVPILAAGNGFVLKHADNVQGNALALAVAFRIAGLPEGAFSVLNVDRDDLPRIIADPRIAAVTVTAGVAAGAAVASEAGRHLKKSVLELGGTDPCIILADADLDRAVPAAVQARFQNSGQVCIAGKRLIVEASIAEEFIRRFVVAAAALRVGDPFDEATDLGPLARHRLRTELQAQVEASLAKGARLLLGGAVPEGAGSYYPATVLADVTPDMPVFREETFGPVAAITVATDAEHAVRLANDSDYGLSGALWCGDPARGARIARRIETGGVFVNGVAMSDPRVPIGGIRRSGYGRELSYFGLREFCNTQLVWVRG